jgi:hypothetical protein
MALSVPENLAQLDAAAADATAQASLFIDTAANIRAVQAGNKLYAAELSRALGHPVGSTFNELIAALKELPDAVAP